MKKVLSVFLAVLMLFGTLGISSSAADTFVAPNLQQAKDEIVELYGENSMYDSVANPTGYVVVSFTVGYGSYMYNLPALNMATGNIEYTMQPGEPYFDIPENTNENYISYTNYTLPKVKGTEEQAFVGWYCPANKETYAMNEVVTLSKDMVDGNSGCIYFNAMYEPIPASSDVLETIINILIKVFGSIIGFLFFEGDPEAGEAFLSEMIGGFLQG